LQRAIFFFFLLSYNQLNIIILNCQTTDDNKQYVLTNAADQYSSIGAAKTVSNYAGSSLIREPNAVDNKLYIIWSDFLGNALWQKQSQRIAITLTLIFAAALADCRRLSGMAVVATREEEGVSKQKIKRTSLFLLYVLISHTALLFLLPFFSSF
jgi:hypothetical protein